MQANTHPKIKISDTKLAHVRNPDRFFSVNTHCVQVANRISKRNNVLKALACTNWEQQKKTLLLTYKTLGIPIENYDVPVWSTHASDSSIDNIQRAQNEELRIITSSHKMSNIVTFTVRPRCYRSWTT